MTRRVLVWFAVVAAVLVVSASPASAVSLASINTTATDFQSASLDDMRIVGSGTEASVTGEVGYTDQVDSGSVTGDDIGTGLNMGVVFTVDSKKGAVWANPDDVASGGADVIELRYQSNGTLIESTSVSGGSIRFGFEADLYPGTEYRLTARQSDGGLVFDQYAQGPVTSGDLTLVSGHAGGSKQSTLVAFESVSVGNASDLSFVGPEHTAQAKSLFANVSTSRPVTVTAQANSGSGWTNVTSTTITASQNVSLDISGSSATRYRTVVEASDKESERSVTVHDEGVTFTALSPSLSNPDPADGSPVSSYDGDISVSVSDADFALVQDDSVTVSAANQNGQIGQTTLNQNGTATLSYTPIGGDNNITWTATDSYGRRTTLTQNFTAPAQLRIYNESAPQELVDNSTVTLRFYRSNQVDVINKTTSNGVVSMAGLPADEAFFVTATADGYLRRTIYVPSLIDSQSVYLLPENETSVPVVFDHADYSGAYPQDETVLIVQRELNGSFRTVQGDVFGATGRYSTELKRDVRHRLVVENTRTGESKVLGPYTPFAAETETVKIVTNGTINVERPPIVEISPGARTLPATATPGLSVVLDNQSNTISTWSVTVTFENNSTMQTLDTQTIQTGAGSYTPSANLSGYSDGVVAVSVTWTTASGESGTETAEFSVTRYRANDHSLLAVLGAVEGQLPSSSAGQFTSVVAAFLSIMAGAVTASQLRAGTEVVGVVVVTTLAGFAVLGWVGYGPVFIGGAGLAALIGLRRGL